VHMATLRLNSKIAVDTSITVLEQSGGIYIHTCKYRSSPADKYTLSLSLTHTHTHITHTHTHTHPHTHTHTHTQMRL
jgi:hypothetical protein